MQVFLSYASEQRSLAEPLALALRDRGHDVFFDKDDLPPGKSYGAQIEAGIRGSDLAIFLISPESVTPGRYTLSEIEFARRQWRSASRRILPVMISPTDKDRIPAYLKTVTILEPKGNMVAEVAAAVEDLRGIEYSIFVALRLGALALAVGLLSYFSFQESGEAILRTSAIPGIGSVPAPEVGFLFGFPIGFAAWQWGVRRWWAFVIPIIIVAACYFVSAPEISRHTLQLQRTQEKDSTRAKFQEIISKVNDSLSETDKAFLIQVRDEIIGLNTTMGRIGAGLAIGMLMALGTMVSLGGL
jgi:TIR domain